MESSSPTDSRPLVISLCGTFLKPEMQSIYRQIANLERFRTVVFTERLQAEDLFPFEDVVVMEKRRRPRPRGNFIKRFWFKHILGVWPPPPKPNSPPPPPFYPYNLVDLLAQYQPALVHVYYGHKAVKYLEMLRAWGGAFVVSFHGVDVVKFLDEPGYRENLRRVFRHAALVLARSQSLLERLRALGCPPEKLRLNRTPIPLDRIPARVVEPPEDGQWLILQACRLIAKKGIERVLEALVTLKEKGYHFHFMLVGEGPLREKIARRVEELGLQREVALRGWLDPHELFALYARAHLFVHPSELTKTEDQEGVPNSLLEAMAAGLPIISTLHGGIPEAVDHGRDGLLVPEKDSVALAAAMEEMMADPAKLEGFSRQAAQSVREKFGFAEQIAHLEDCYEQAQGVGQERESVSERESFPS